MERTEEPVRVRTVLLLKDTSMALATELAEGAEEMNGEQFMGRMREVWLERERQAENAGRIEGIAQRVVVQPEPEAHRTPPAVQPPAAERMPLRRYSLKNNA